MIVRASSTSTLRNYYSPEGVQIVHAQSPTSLLFSSSALPTRDCPFLRLSGQSNPPRLRSFEVRYPCNITCTKGPIALPPHYTTLHSKAAAPPEAFRAKMRFSPSFEGSALSSDPMGGREAGQTLGQYLNDVCIGGVQYSKR